MQRLAGDVSRVWRKQEFNRRSDIFWAADAAERNAPDEEADGLGARRGGRGAEGALRRTLEHDWPGAAAQSHQCIWTRGKMKRVGIGVIGCGVISGAYLKAAQGFPILDIRGLADAVPAAAEARARSSG